MYKPNKHIYIVRYAFFESRTRSLTILNIKLGTFLYSECKSYSELVRVSAVNKIF